MGCFEPYEPYCDSARFLTAQGACQGRFLAIIAGEKQRR